MSNLLEKLNDFFSVSTLFLVVELQNVTMKKLFAIIGSALFLVAAPDFVVCLVPCNRARALRAS